MEQKHGVVILFGYLLTHDERNDEQKTADQIRLLTVAEKYASGVNRVAAGNAIFLSMSLC